MLKDGLKIAHEDTRARDHVTRKDPRVSKASTEMDPVRLRALAQRARRLADGAQNGSLRDRFSAAAEEYEQRATEVELDETTGQ
jgi:hypothetical protein